MCFTPTISLLTAVIEFTIATIILIFFRKSLINRFFVSLIYFLGLYQFTEFMLCISNNPLLWSKFGFIAYSFLPGIAIYYISKYTFKNAKQKYLRLIYLLPIMFSVIALAFGEFITKVECSQFFVIGTNMLWTISPVLHSVYQVYYGGSIILASIFLLHKMKYEKNKTKKKIQISILTAILISLVPALILITILPSLEIYFPSIYCEFAILFSIAALIAAQLDKKLKK
jgi:hypothetical protein